MNFLSYLKKKIPDVIIHLIFILIISIIALNFNIPLIVIYFLITIYTIIFSLYYYVDYRKIMNKFKNYNKLIEDLDKKYLFLQLLSYEDFEEERWLQILSKMSKSMLEEVNLERKGKETYRDYIEIMIHEIKNPLATINLICDNDKGETSRKITLQTEQISNLIEQALYLAKIENMEKDYFIKEISLEKLVNSAIMQNKGALLENGFSIETLDLKYSVYTDEKWTVFIINQLISNSIKYRKERPKIIVRGKSLENGIELSIEDNGIGFNKYEVGRVFDKGFTGEKSHNLNSTGMGLYITHMLSERLNIFISIDSSKKSGAKIDLIFPINDFSKQL